MNDFSIDRGRVFEAIGDAERRTSGEIRVVVYAHPVDDPVAAARREFERLAMHRTRERNAVLILISPESHAYAIYGDEGVHARCGEHFWKTVAEHMGACFAKGDFTEGLVRAVHETAQVLAREFPRRDDDRNELPDDMIERGTVI